MAKREKSDVVKDKNYKKAVTTPQHKWCPQSYIG